MSSGRFDGRVAVVTGAAGGMGTAIALELGAGGAKLALVDLEQERLDAAVAALPEGTETITLALDITDDNAPSEVADAARDAFGRVDILVNNAGIARFGRAERYVAQDWDDVMDVNLRAPFLLSQAVGRLMLEDCQGGSIVNIGSIGGRTANPQNVPYGVSKAAILGLTQQLAVEWGPYGIRVNAVNPGLTTWHMRALEPDWEVKRKQTELVPLKRLAEPSDIAGVVGFLCSEAARCITGVMIDVDGGYLLSLLSQLPRPERLLQQVGEERTSGR